MARTEQWSNTTVERKCEPLRSEAIATIEHQETIIARMKAIAARVGEQPLSAAEVSEFQALMAESAAFQRHLLALKSEIQMWWLREEESCGQKLDDLADTRSPARSIVKQPQLAASNR